MNRRTFLKSIAIACGAAVVCPGELLNKPDHWIRAATLRKKNAVMGRKLIHRKIILHPAQEHFCKFHKWKHLTIEELYGAYQGQYYETIQTTHRPNPSCSQACDSPD